MLRALTVLRGSESVCRMENELSFCLRVQCLCAVLCCGNLFDNMLNCVGFVVNWSKNIASSLWEKTVHTWVITSASQVIRRSFLALSRLISALFLCCYLESPPQFTKLGLPNSELKQCCSFSYCSELFSFVMLYTMMGCSDRPIFTQCNDETVLWILEYYKREMYIYIIMSSRSYLLLVATISLKAERMSALISSN